MKSCLALDFGGSSLKHAVVGEDASVRVPGRRPAALDSPEQFAEVVRDLYVRHRHEVDGIAICIPGRVDADTGFLYDAGAYRNLWGHNIPDLLRSDIAVPISVENDGKCAALAEVWNGSLSSDRDGAVILLGTAVGGAIIQDGKVRQGKGFMAGEFSYATTDLGDGSILGSAFMSCGALGMTYKLCKAKNLDLTVQDSAPTLAWLDLLLKDRYAPQVGEPLKVKADGEQIFQWIDEGDAVAKSVYDEFLVSLASLVHNIQVVYAPEKIAIGGGLSLQERVLPDLGRQLERYYKTTELVSAMYADVIRCQHRSDGNVVGAAYSFMSRYGWEQVAA